MNEEVLKKLYQSGIEHYSLPSFDVFKNDMLDKEKALSFKKSMSVHYSMPDDETFLSDIGAVDSKKKEDFTFGETDLDTNLEDTSLDTRKTEDQETFQAKDYLGEFLGGAIDAGVRQGKSVDETFSLIVRGNEVSDEDLNSYIKAVEKMQQDGPSEDMIEFQKVAEENGGGLMGFITAVKEKPSAVGEVALTSFAGMISGAIDKPEGVAAGAGTLAATGAAAGTLGGPFAPATSTVGAISGGLAGAMGAAGGMLETAMSYTEFLEEELNGKKFTPENIREILNDDEKRKSIRNRAITRGGVIGIVDALSAGLAGKAATSVTKVTSKTLGKGMSAAAGLATSGAVEAVGGGSGEALARAAVGQEMDAIEIGLEAIGGAPKALVTGPVGLALNSKKTTYSINGETVDRETTKDVIESMTSDQISKSDIKIKNDDVLESVYRSKKRRAEIEKQLPEDISESNKEEIIDLELKRKELEGKNTVSAKQRIKQIESEIAEKSKPVKEEQVVEAESTEDVVTEEDVQQELVKPELESKLTYETSRDTEVKVDEKGKFLSAVNKRTGKESTNQTRRKAQNELISQRDYTTGKSAFDGIPPGQDITDPSQLIANESENAQEIAKEYQSKKKEQTILDPVVEAFVGKYKVLSKDLKDYYKSEDEKAAALGYIRGDKGRKPLSLDAIAMEVSEEVGRDVSPQELFDIMMDPKYKSNTKPKESNIVTELRNRFIEITGFDGTDAQIDAIANQDPSKLKPVKEPKEVVEEIERETRPLAERDVKEQEFYERVKNESKEQESIENKDQSTEKTFVEKYKSTLDSIKNIAKKFTVLAGKKKSFRAITENLSNQLALHGYNMNIASQKYAAALKKIKENPFIKEAQERSELILSGAGLTEQEMSQAKERGYVELLDVTSEMRDHVDSLSETLISVVGGNMTKAQRKKVSNNIGTYLNRSYRIFEDKNYTPTQNSIDSFKRYMTENASEWILNSGLTLNEAASIESSKNNISIEEAIDIITSREIDFYIEEKDSPVSIFTDSKGINKSILKRLKDVPNEVREFYGEITEPEARYRNTVAKMASLIEKVRFQESLKKDGLGVYLFEENDINRPKDHNVKIAGEKSERFSPLAGLYTTKDIAQIINPSSKNIHKGIGLIMKLNSFVKGGKTVFSVASHPRNYFSNISLLYYNGHMNGKDLFKNTRDVVAAEITGKIRGKVPKEEYVKKRKKYIELGLIGQSVRFGDFVAASESLFNEKVFYESVNDRLQEQARKSKKALKSIAGVKNKSKASFDKIIEIFKSSYNAGDDIFKITAFEVEKKQRMKALGGQDTLTESEISEIENEVAEYIRDVYPTYDRVPPMIKAVGRAPLTGSFVSFQSEMYRTAWNTFTKANELKNSKVEGLRDLGRKKMKTAIYYQIFKTAAFTTVGGSLYALGKSYLGDDEEVESLQVAKDMRNVVAPWSKNSRLFVTRRGGGKVTYIDYSANDAHGIFAKMIQEGVSEDNIKEKMAKILLEGIGPFTEPEILISATNELINNKKSSGAPVFRENDSLAEKGKKMISHFMKAILPGTVLTLDRIVDKDRSTFDELAGITGFRPVTIDLNESLGYKAYNMQKNLKEIKKDFRFAKRNLVKEGEQVDMEKYKDLYERYNSIYQDALEENIKVVNSFRRLGANINQVESFDLFSKDERDAIRNGRIIPLARR